MNTTNVKIISNHGCGRCVMVQRWLSEYINTSGRTDINVTYLMIDDLKNKDEYIAQAQGIGIHTFPLMFVDEKPITFEQLKKMLG